MELAPGRVPADFLVAVVRHGTTGAADLVGRVSIRVIERYGGVLQDVRQLADGAPKRRYWIDSRR